MSLLAGCVYHTGALRKQVRVYTGDGVITDISLAAPLLFSSPGFKIVLPPFDSSKPYEQVYNLAHVPQTGPKDSSSIDICFPGEWSLDLDQIQQNVTASLSFEIRDDTGAILKALTIPFKDRNTIWSWAGGGGKGEFGLWVEDSPLGAKNGFYFDPAKHYTLHITYTPGEIPPATTQMWITIKNGGTI